MGVSELRQLNTRVAGDVGLPTSLGHDLMQAGQLSFADEAMARLVARQSQAPMSHILVTEGLITRGTLLDTHARRHGAKVLSAADLAELLPDPDAPAPAYSLRHAALPVRRQDGSRAFLTADPDAPDTPTDLPLLLADPDAIQTFIAHAHRNQLTEAASTRVPPAESARTWGLRPRQRVAIVLGVLAVLALVTILYPIVIFAGLALWAGLTLMVSTALKLATYLAQTARLAPPPSEPDRPLPTVSLLVPLYRETAIAHALITRLRRLTYPKCALDVLLVVEETDDTTRATLAAIDLPDWMRVISVPDGHPRTKPRAMNYALDFCRGDIIGIFDAEDAPEPDQILKVARRFNAAPKEMACLQGILDYYNPRQTWLARCFAIEYATWFRLILPGMVELGLAIPLGGTTVYFRRNVLEQVGGWDAHNVTEDADLGIRLARHGYRTEMIDSVTGEEANHKMIPWIKQRSRWLKGYMVTYLVHMRRPLLLLRQLGARKFWGFQAHFLGAISQFLLAPVLWSFWLILFGISHPLDGIVPHGTLIALGAGFLLVEILGLFIHISAVSGPEHRHLIPWTPTMHFYTPLGAIAGYKALYEVIASPFYWDKTAHGHSLADAD